jgi:predicted ATP-grasp superfamily ATP-dependent carboligase
MEKAAETADAAYVIAPEPNHVLQSIVECIESTGILSLNCQSFAIEQVSEKQNFALQVKSLGLAFPKTLTFTTENSLGHVAAEIESQLVYPVVIKPISSAGCSGLSLVQEEKQLTGAIEKFKAETFCSNFFVAQEYIQGTPASVSLICNGEEATPISLNLQYITLAGPEGASCYNGGMVPLEHPLKTQAFNAAKRLVESFSGLRGYVGVDLILDKDQVFVMEINPRLTSSYIGLRQVAQFNLAESIVKAVTQSRLPQNPQIYGYCSFNKHQISASNLLHLQQIYADPAIVSPPFPQPETNQTCTLIQAQGPTAQTARQNLLKTQKQLQQIITGGS